MTASSVAAQQIWKARKAKLREEITDAERAAKAIHDKLDRLDEAFLFERSIDIDTYDRHAEKLREELTLARIDRYSGQLEELDVEGILAFAERVFAAGFVPLAPGVTRTAAAVPNCSFPTESPSTEIALFEPP